MILLKVRVVYVPSDPFSFTPPKHVGLQRAPFPPDLSADGPLALLHTHRWSYIGRRRETAFFFRFFV